MGHRGRNLLLTAGVLVAAGAAPAMAMVSFLGETTVPSGSVQRLTLSVPLDGLPGTTRVEITTPEGWTVGGCEATEPWICRTDRYVTPGLGYVRFDRNPLAPPAPGEGVFVFTAQAGGPGPADFTVSQSDALGQVRVWEGPPGSDDPGARLTIGPPLPPVTTTTTAPAPTPTTLAPAATTTTTAAPVTTTTLAPTTTTTAPSVAATPPTTVTTAPRSAAVAVDWDAMASELAAARPQVLGVSLSRQEVPPGHGHGEVKATAVTLLSLVAAALAVVRHRLLYGPLNSTR